MVRIAVIPGDGVGQEVVESALQVAAVVAPHHKIDLDLVHFPWSCQWYTKYGRMMPADWREQLDDTEAILLGAVGYPGVPDYVSLWGLLLPMRQHYSQYVNLRPIKALEGIPIPLIGKQPSDIDMLLVRENTEGEYAGQGGRMRAGTDQEVATQTSVFTWKGVERLVRYGFEAARRRSGQLASATKSNALQYTSVMWDEVVEKVSQDYPDVEVSSYLIDALAARLITSPESFDVIVASNLFGDIIADIGAALMGSMGLAPSGNLNPEGTSPSLFEPVHGSAPDLAGQGKANPIAAVWSLAMMFEQLGEQAAARQIMEAVQQVARTGPHTADIGGTGTTQQVTKALVEAAQG